MEENRKKALVASPVAVAPSEREAQLARIGFLTVAPWAALNVCS